MRDRARIYRSDPRNGRTFLTRVYQTRDRRWWFDDLDHGRRHWLYIGLCVVGWIR